MGLYKHRKTLVEQTDGTDATNYYYLVMESFRYAVAHCILSGGSGTVTVSVEASIDPATVGSNTDLANLDWEDITNEYFGVASITATGFFVFDTPFPWRALRFKVVSSTGGADDADWTIHVGAMD